MPLKSLKAFQQYSMNYNYSTNLFIVLCLIKCSIVIMLWCLVKILVRFKFHSCVFRFFSPLYFKLINIDFQRTIILNIIINLYNSIQFIQLGRNRKCFVNILWIQTCSGVRSLMCLRLFVTLIFWKS